MWTKGKAPKVPAAPARGGLVAVSRGELGRTAHVTTPVRGREKVSDGSIGLGRTQHLMPCSEKRAPTTETGASLGTPDGVLHKSTSGPACGGIRSPQVPIAPRVTWPGLLMKQ